MEFGLTGKTAIVTGGASNLGRAIVLALAKEGANVVIADIDQQQARKTAAAAEKLGAKTLLVITDVTNQDACKEMAKRTLAEFGRIDVLVNNAGGSSYVAFSRDLPLDEAKKIMELNFWSAFNCSQAVVGQMIEQKSGKIVHIVSNSGLSARPRMPLYAAAKAAVVSLTKSQSDELVPHGIHVNCVAPGLILPNSPEEVGDLSAHKNPPEGLKAFLASGAAHGKPEDIANTVVLLASDAVGFVSGQTYCVFLGAGMAV